mmetsp:Transcript_9319/g.13929  ORF Transcript_9319/g.13929 Transcript_9319/m.13929 type:complete len:174 (-) Transcript_9319:134-655(-)
MPQHETVCTLSSAKRRLMMKQVDRMASMAKDRLSGLLAQKEETSGSSSWTESCMSYSEEQYDAKEDYEWATMRLNSSMEESHMSDISFDHSYLDEESNTDNMTPNIYSGSLRSCFSYSNPDESSSRNDYEFLQTPVIKQVQAGSTKEGESNPRPRLNMLSYNSTIQDYASRLF